jgi:hypothetical protein
MEVTHSGLLANDLEAEGGELGGVDGDLLSGHHSVLGSVVGRGVVDRGHDG